MRHPTVVGCFLALSLTVTTTATVLAAVPIAGTSEGAETTATVEIPERLTREEVRDLLSKLSDGQVRALLIRELDKEDGGRTYEERSSQHHKSPDMRGPFLAYDELIGKIGALSFAPEGAA